MVDFNCDGGCGDGNCLTEEASEVHELFSGSVLLSEGSGVSGEVAVGEPEGSQEALRGGVVSRGGRGIPS